MILVVDSGSTKTDWIAIDEKGSVLFSTQTLGLNPQVLSSAILNERIINNYDLFLDIYCTEIFPYNIFIK